MSSSHGGGGDAWSHLKWVIYILIGLWLVWFFTGGPQRYEQSQNQTPFIQPQTAPSTTIN